MFSHRSFTHITSRITLLVVFLFIHSSSPFASNNQSNIDSDLLTSFLNLTVEGVSLSMSPTEIQAKLQAMGYAQVSHTTFVKERPLAGGRQVIYRIEIEHTPNSRKLGYFRSESGGRNKSPVTLTLPIPEQEAKWVNALYELVCSDIPSEISVSRQCEPASEVSVRFGQGNPLSLSPTITTQLAASAGSISLNIIYHKQ